MQLTEEDWKKKLTPTQYEILRQKGTEIPFTGEHLNNKNNGTYTCVACGTELFSSDTKFESDSGWPSFSDVVKSNAVKLIDDDSFGMHRVEVQCASCGGHLGHVFEDGPTETKQRYCINSVCLAFEPKNKKETNDQ